MRRKSQLHSAQIISDMQRSVSQQLPGISELLAYQVISRVDAALSFNNSSLLFKKMIQLKRRRFV
jgi:hypothetical protein